MAQVKITIDPSNLPKPTTHANVQVWADIKEPSVHSLGQTSLEQAKQIIIDSGEGSAVTMNRVSDGHFTLSFG